MVAPCHPTINPCDILHQMENQKRELAHKEDILQGSAIILEEKRDYTGKKSLIPDEAAAT